MTIAGGDDETRSAGLRRPTRSTAPPRRRGIESIVAVMLAFLLVFLMAPVMPVSAAVVPGSRVDLQITVSGPSTARSGDSFTYVVVMNSNSPPDADGAGFAGSFSGGTTGVAAACQAVGGAVCPVDLAVSDSGASGALGAFPHLGRITITVTGTFVGSSSVTDSEPVAPPASAPGAPPAPGPAGVPVAPVAVADPPGIVSPARRSTTGPGDRGPSRPALALTGSDPALALLAGFLLITGGAGTVLAARRRRHLR